MCVSFLCVSLVSEQRSKGQLVMTKPVTRGDKIEEVERKVGAVKMRLEEMA